MEPSTMAPPLPERLSRQPSLCNAENIGVAGVSATPGFASGSGPAAGSPDKETPYITLRSPRSSTGVPSSPPSRGLTSESPLPEVISSADLSSGAQPVMQLAFREANSDEVTHWGHRRHLGEASGPSAEPMPWRPASPRVAAASKGEEEAAAIEADNDWPLRPASDVSAVTGLCDLPNEVLLQIFRCLDVCDLLCTSRVSKRAAFAPVSIRNGRQCRCSIPTVHVRLSVRHSSRREEDTSVFSPLLAAGYALAVHDSYTHADLHLKSTRLAVVTVSLLPLLLDNLILTAACQSPSYRGD